MQRQLELFQPDAHVRQKAPGVLCALKRRENVGVAYVKDFSTGISTSPSISPKVVPFGMSFRREGSARGFRYLVVPQRLR